MSTDPIQTLLGRLQEVREVAGGWQARCPAHADDSPSLSITAGQDGRALIHCHAGCEAVDVVHALELEWRDLFPAKSGGSQIVGTYDYVDDAGNVRYQVVRFAPKEFRQRHRCPQNRTDGWEWGLGGNTERCSCPKFERVLYRLPEVAKAARAGGVVFVVEGEKDADRLAGLGLTATCNLGGAGKWRKSYAHDLRGTHVVILPDYDVPGRDHAQQVARGLHGVASTLKVVNLPGLLEHGDVSDWLDAGHDLRELFELVKSTSGWTPVMAAQAQPAASAVAVPDPQAANAPTRLFPEDAPSLTDTGNSTRLITLHGERLRHVHAWGTWLVWDGTHWEHDPKTALLDELAKDVGVGLKQEAVGCTDEAVAKQLFAWGQTSLSAGKIRAMAVLARGIPGVLIDHEQLDADGWLLGVQNGVLELKTGRFRTADPRDLMTVQTPVIYDPAARCPRWEQALREWFPDETVRAYVQRVAGAALVGEQRDHVFVIHYGEGGNGKGTFVRALEAVLGPYATKIHLSLLIEVKYREHDTVRAALFRTRLAVAEETSQVARLNESSVKNLTGGDRIMARRMREDPWSFSPTHSLWLQTNHLPQIQGRDTGIWRRIRVVRWVSHFAVGQNADTGLDARLSVEGPGILNWLLEGCRMWQAHGLQEPETVMRDTLAYRASQDVLERFAEDAGLEFRQGLAMEGARLQEKLKEWLEQEGLPQPTNKAVGDWLLSHGARSVRQMRFGKQRKWWFGVGVPGEDGAAATEPNLLEADTGP